jgi:glycosyltransferase involved in cell wall biosynthesis
LIKSEIDVYISVCNRNAEWASKEMNISKTFILPNIVKRLKTEEIKPDKDYVLVGNVSPQKNYEFLIDFSTAFNNEQFDIYYGGYSSEEYLNELIADKTENINFIYGEKNIQQIIKRYKMALHCAHAESGPLVLIEYLAQGVPFITYNTGEVVAQIKKDLPEFIVNSFNKDEWIMAINRINELINEDIESLKLRMKKVYEDNFSEEKYFEKCLKIYKSV